jgi:hypothetical protein
MTGSRAITLIAPGESASDTAGEPTPPTLARDECTVEHAALSRALRPRTPQRASKADKAVRPGKDLPYCKFGPPRSRLPQATLVGTDLPRRRVERGGPPAPESSRPRVATLYSVCAVSNRLVSAVSINCLLHALQRMAPAAREFDAQLSRRKTASLPFPRPTESPDDRSLQTPRECYAAEP